MFSLSKARFVALGVMFGMGVSAPAAAWYVNQSEHVATLKNALPLERTVVNVAGVQREEQLVADQLVIVIPARKHRMRHNVKRADSEPERHCSWHSSETLASGTVRICDIQRSANHRTGTLMAPRMRGVHLAPRDAPSPSGFLD